MDLFLTQLSQQVVRIQYSKKIEAIESLMRQDQIKAFITFIETKYGRIFHRHLDESWKNDIKSMNNMKRVWLEAQKLIFLNPDAIQWEKVHKRLVITPDRHLKNQTCVCFKSPRICT
ncbi:hypothetical protein CDAR_283351 [Caerostris darwini]|uniref:Uncharacterized protein n=1 Tax=Caerostris darwini TaxID=1538125 RepID=A0AAV4UEG6_9ARAC|nr:hypothetical protein CDAR_283351 [Caerostris darwini]